MLWHRLGPSPVHIVVLCHKSTLWSQIDGKTPQSRSTRWSTPVSFRWTRDMAELRQSNSSDTVWTTNETRSAHCAGQGEAPVQKEWRSVWRKTLHRKWLVAYHLACMNQKASRRTLFVSLWVQAVCSAVSCLRRAGKMEQHPRKIVWRMQQPSQSHPRSTWICPYRSSWLRSRPQGPAQCNSRSGIALW